MYTLQRISKRARKVLKDFLNLQQTLTQSNVPILFREPGIIRGYRKLNKPWTYYIISLFQIHNETINVWTHLIGLFVLYLTIPECEGKLDYWTKEHPWILLIFATITIITSTVSTGAHLLHSKSEEWHYNAFMIDYIGATLYAYGSGLMSFYINSDEETYIATEYFYFPVLWVYSWFNYVVLCSAKVYFGSDIHNRYRRFIMVTSMFGSCLLQSIPMGPRYVKCFQDEFCSFYSLNHITAEYVLFGLQAFFFAGTLPQTLSPGTFDIVGQGHQIFHVLVTVCQYVQFHAIYVDIDNASNHSTPNPLYLVVSTIALILVKLISFQIIRQFIKVDTVNTKINYHSKPS